MHTFSDAAGFCHAPTALTCLKSVCCSSIFLICSTSWTHTLHSSLAASLSEVRSIAALRSRISESEAALFPACCCTFRVTAFVQSLMSALSSALSILVCLQAPAASTSLKALCGSSIFLAYSTFMDSHSSSVAALLSDIRSIAVQPSEVASKSDAALFPRCCCTFKVTAFVQSLTLTRSLSPSLSIEHCCHAHLNLPEVTVLLEHLSGLLYIHGLAFFVISCLIVRGQKNGCSTIRNFRV